MEFTREIVEALGAPFPDDELEFLPRAQSGGKALGLPYIDARSVMRRLDAAVGPGNWSFDFDLLSGDGKMVKGRLTVLGVTKCDAGESSAEDEVLKSAVSDALKRCAVHFGIGRYLYYLPRVWAPYDAQKRRFTETPRVDRSALEKALAICGIHGRVDRPPVSLRVEAAPASRIPSTEEQTGSGKSIWAAGSAPVDGNAPQPESSGDRAAGRSEARSAESSAESGTAQAPACSEPACGKSLTKGQQEMSTRAYGRPLCPACQKQHARAA